MNLGLKMTVVGMALLSSLSVNAQKPKAAPAGNETYKIDTKESKLTWTGTKKIGSAHTGGVSFKEGQVELKKGDLTGGNFKVDMTTLNDVDLAKSPENQKKLETHLKSADFFHVEKYPEATFKITQVQKKSDKDYVIKGDLTMIGNTQPIEFPATITKEKDVLKGDAKVKVDRTKWGLKYGSGDFFKELTGDKIINNEFELDLKLVAKK